MFSLEVRGGKPAAFELLRAEGVDCVFGDAAESDVLEAAGTRKAAQVIVAVPDMEVAKATVMNARALNPGARILARVHHPAGPERLIAAGATEVIQPEFEAASTLIRHALRGLDVPRDRVLAYLELLREAMDATGPGARAAGRNLPELREIAVESEEVELWLYASARTAGRKATSSQLSPPSSLSWSRPSA